MSAFTPEQEARIRAIMSEQVAAALPERLRRVAALKPLVSVSSDAVSGVPAFRLNPDVVGALLATD